MQQSGAFNLWGKFAETAAAQPDAPALLFEEELITFGTLRRLAEGCDAYLREHGVAKGDVVALRLAKRLESYALFLACLRIGCLYVFIDVKNPKERTARIVERLKPKLLISADRIDNPFGGVLVLQSTEAEGWLRGGAAAGRIYPPSDVSGADPAYVMFTSGSTGEPKGAVIPHQGVLSLMSWGRSKIGAGPGERFTGINPLHFDNSVFDLYCGLVNGAALVPIETGELPSPVSWVRLIRAAAPTVMFAVPTLFLILDGLGLLTPGSLPTVKTFVFGGEGFPIGRLREFYGRFEGRARLVNVYGPTETSCISTSLELDASALQTADDSFPPLGRMHENFGHAVLDEQGRAVASGETGELWIGGPCVGLGYYGNVEQTHARFRQDPRQDRYRSIWYRSGDLVREDEAGLLWFQGRADNQVKIRGYRIELEEVDLVVQTVAGVRRALTAVVGVSGEMELHVAFVADTPVPADEIEAACRERLPAYMRPTRYVQLDELPRNANGKVDRRATKALLEDRSGQQ